VRVVLDARSWGSLHQKDADGKRTAPEQAAFDTAKKTMGMWYAHRLTTTVILSEQPPGWPRSAEDAPFFPEGWLRGKGWPSFERAVSGMIKRGSRYSFRRIVDSAVPRGFGFTSYRAPPMHPREFAAELSRKVFTNGAKDCEMVAELYADTLCAALGKARVLEFEILQWKDADAEAFAKVLPLLKHVETLNLRGNKIGTRGFAALAKAISEGAAPALKEFVFGGGLFEGDWTALKEACMARKISTPLFSEHKVNGRVMITSSASDLLPRVLRSLSPKRRASPSPLPPLCRASTVIGLATAGLPPPMPPPVSRSISL
jgi:hypothetical protein